MRSVCVLMNYLMNNKQNRKTFPSTKNNRKCKLGESKLLEILTQFRVSSQKPFKRCQIFFICCVKDSQANRPWAEPSGAVRKCIMQLSVLSLTEINLFNTTLTTSNEEGKKTFKQIDSRIDKKLVKLS